MKRDLYVVPGMVDHRKMEDYALECTKAGDDVTVHYHRKDVGAGPGVPVMCNQKCHKAELPEED